MTYKVKATGKVVKDEGHYLATYAWQPDKRWLQQYFMMVPMTPKRRNKSARRR